MGNTAAPALPLQAQRGAPAFYEIISLSSLYLLCPFVSLASFFPLSHIFYQRLYPDLHILRSNESTPRVQYRDAVAFAHGKFLGGQIGSEFMEDRLASSTAVLTVPDQ